MQLKKGYPFCDGYMTPKKKLGRGSLTVTSSPGFFRDLPRERHDEGSNQG